MILLRFFPTQKKKALRKSIRRNGIIKARRYCLWVFQKIFTGAVQPLLISVRVHGTWMAAAWLWQMSLPAVQSRNQEWSLISVLTANRERSEVWVKHSLRVLNMPCLMIAIIQIMRASISITAIKRISLCLRKWALKCSECRSHGLVSILTVMN